MTEENFQGKTTHFGWSNPISSYHISMVYPSSSQPWQWLIPDLCMNFPASHLHVQDFTGEISQLAMFNYPITLKKPQGIRTWMSLRSRPDLAP